MEKSLGIRKKGSLNETQGRNESVTGPIPINPQDDLFQSGYLNEAMTNLIPSMSILDVKVMLRYVRPSKLAKGGVTTFEPSSLIFNSP
jgi:hypothetical protein